MVPIDTSTSDTPIATVFTAVLARELFSDTVQFEIINNQIAVIVSGTVIDLSSITEQGFANVTINYLGEDTFSATFSSGAYLEVREENEMFSVVVVALPQGFMEKNTRGLMGSFNGNSTDDLLPRLGQQPLSLNGSLQEIHAQFGITCKLTIFITRHIINRLYHFLMQGLLILLKKACSLTNQGRAGRLTMTHSSVLSMNLFSPILLWSNRQ